MEYIYYFFIFLFGLSFGSFLNAWIWRTHHNMKIMTDRSICPNCHLNLAWYDNIPLFSYLLMLRGKCRHCHQRISWQYPLVEIGVALLFVFVTWWHEGQVFTLTPELLRDIILVYLLVFVFIYDYKYREILDQGTILPALILFPASMALHWHTWQSMTLGILVAAGFFSLQYFASKGRWIGGGDVRLGILMGVVLGWPVIIFALALAYIGGALVSVLLILFGKNKLSDETPFGAYLAVGTFVAMFWGPEIINWYLNLLY